MAPPAPYLLGLKVRDAVAQTNAYPYSSRLLAHMSALVSGGRSQFIIATHSPILLTFPGAQILSLDGEVVQAVSLEETSHYQITKGILQNPGSYWKHL